MECDGFFFSTVKYFFLFCLNKWQCFIECKIICIFFMKVFDVRNDLLLEGLILFIYEKAKKKSNFR